jgi:hypothetical protein
MKYVGIITIDDKRCWSEWHSGSTSKTYRSDGYDTREEAQAWIDSQLPNIKNDDGKYKVDTIIAKFDKKDLVGQFPKIDYMFNNVLWHKNVTM